jgi:glycosyltransferase involved in cell wall biosynthesis
MSELIPPASIHDETVPLGVTVAICTYNGAERLPATLKCLRGQVVPPEVLWEVIVIDNASADNGSEVALAYWSSEVPVPLRVVREERLGLSYARERAFAEAIYPIVLFVDDDNWLNSNWVRTVSNVMTTRPEVGACGGVIEPFFETTPAPWAGDFKKWPPDGECSPGDVTDTIGWLMGAGLTIRRSAFRQISEAGFRSLAVDRQGKSLTVGGDAELCFALRMAGWRIWHEASLKMEHFLPVRRLTWHYTCEAIYGCGLSDAALDGYKFLLENTTKRSSRIARTWSWQLLLALKWIAQNLIRRPGKVIRRRSSRYEGDPEVLRIFRYFGHLDGLWKFRRNYSANYRAVSRLADSLSKSGSHRSEAGRC